MEKIKRTTQVSSNIGTSCDHCNERIGAFELSGDITPSINHYIEAHGYCLLHVGTQTSHDTNGQPWQSTVAILGHDNPSAVKPPPTVIVGAAVEPPERD